MKQRITLLAVLAGIGLATAALAQQPRSDAPAPAAVRDAGERAGIVFPSRVQQGALVIGKVPAGSQARFGGRDLRVTPYGSVAFGIGRDATGEAMVEVTPPNASTQRIAIAIDKRAWAIQHVRGVPPSTVNPPPKIAARIARESARIVEARRTDSSGTDFAQAFQWPVQGRISGRFGNQRIYDGTPKSPHSGMDIAAPGGTPIKAPAGGTVTLAEPDFYVTGGTVMIDHGMGVGSNFLHMSRLDVKVGDVVKQGDVIGAVGSTGRSTGPHLHWGMTWFDTRIDPLLVLERGKN